MMPGMENLHIGLVQTSLVWEDVDANLQRLETLILPMQTDLIVLPEMFSTGFSMDPEKLAAEAGNKSLAAMQRWASSTGAAICGSTMWAADDGFTNRCWFVFPDGSSSFYDKRHLFSLGKEHRHYKPGNEKRIVAYKGWNIALFVCYDLRFPVWSRNRGEYDLAVYVANWPQARIAHWDVLLPARAVENQCYVAGVNRVGEDGNDIPHTGHSAFYGPDGSRICFAGEGKESVLHAEADAEKLVLYRRQLPFLKDADPI
jgi:predicted amidohydrolase